MDKRIEQCLKNEQGSYILPFLWLHGESKERIYEELLAIKNSGIYELCAESRPYEGFCGEQWWEDFGFILKSAKELGLSVWLLDDRHFPTGYANGYLQREENSHLRKRLIREIQIDVVGPMKSAKLFVGGRIRAEEKIISAIAYKFTGAGEELDARSAIDVTDKIKDGFAYLDIPSGEWRVCVSVESKPYEYENENLFYYIDMINPDSCRAMIDAVYAPHYEHFAEYFGNTFKGFFSDEPGFLNVAYTYYNKLGMIGSPYPWRDDLIDLIAKSAGIEPCQMALYLPALWESIGGITPLVRMHYMEVVTKLYSQCFTYALGDWCREHGVMYIGHVIEDMGTHARLGYGSGHYFRALDGQDMAGVDIVLMQDIPGFSSIHRAPTADGGATDPAFFHYTLPKLASSHAHIQPLKKGRAMCEIFGAFGWAEGLPYMKALADSMLVSGINYFVPHAFSPKDEDEDCPPHFYNGGRNIQYPYFKSLMEYMQRSAHVISGGTHICDVAVFYNVEGEWCSGENHKLAEICKTLTRAQIDFDIVPYDALLTSSVKDSELYINGERYGALIVSHSEIMPSDRTTLFKELSDSGLSVIFADSLPRLTEKGDKIECEGFKTVKLCDLISELKKCGLYHIEVSGDGAEYLRFYHVKRDGGDVYLFSNDGVGASIDVEILTKHKGECLIYDPWVNKCYKRQTGDGVLRLVLERSNTLFAYFGAGDIEALPELKYEAQRIPIELKFDISIMQEGEGEFVQIAKCSELFDISAPDKFKDFSGKVRYTATLEATEGFEVIDLGQVGEVCQVWLNGECLGTRINAPYKFDMTKSLHSGKNLLEITVTGNLAHKRTDNFSSYLPIPPTGILGPVELCRYK